MFFINLTVFLIFQADKNLINHFTDSFLHCDGVFVVRMLTLHSGVIFGNDLVSTLWQFYNGFDNQIKRSNSYPEIEILQQSIFFNNLKLIITLDFDTDTNADEFDNFKLRLRKSFLKKKNDKKQKNQYQTVSERIIKPPLVHSHIIKPVATQKTSIVD